MGKDFDVAVIGGGPAGSAAAITAARSGSRVLQLEKGTLPRQRVCGEFVSPESLEILSRLLPEEALLQTSKPISSTRIFVDDEVLSLRITPPAASITRFDLDAALWRSALACGVDARQRVHVQAIESDGDFKVDTTDGSFAVKAIVNASGRWSNLSSHQQTKTSQPRQLAAKAHYCESAPANSVDLYFFEGGYCGVQPVASDVVNVCAIVKAATATSLDEVFSLHPMLWRRSRAWELVFSPVSTSPLIFRKPEPVCKRIFQVGDAAGFIDPFVGDGISLALRSGTMAAESLAPFLREECELKTALTAYSKRYMAELVPPFRAASYIRKLFRIPRAMRWVTARAIQWSGIGERLVLATR